MSCTVGLTLRTEALSDEDGFGGADFLGKLHDGFNGNARNAGSAFRRLCHTVGRTHDVGLVVRLGWSGLGQRLFVVADAVLFQEGFVDPVVADEFVGDGFDERGVGTRADRDPLIGACRATKMCIAVVTGYAVDLANKYIRRRYLAGRKTKRTASSKNDNSKITDSADESKHSGYSVQAAQTVNAECTHNKDTHTHNGKSVHVHDEKIIHTDDEKSTHTHHGHIHYDGTDIEEKHIHDLCEQEHCNCEDGIWMSALKHTLKITVFILAVSFVLNIIIGIAGEDAIGRLLGDVPFLGEAMAALIGLIPNCAPSVIITELYLDGMLSAGAMMSGLLVSAGVGLLVLFRMNRHRLKENIMVVGTLYVTSVCWGLLINLLGITF